MNGIRAHVVVDAGEVSHVVHAKRSACLPLGGPEQANHGPVEQIVFSNPIQRPALHVDVKRPLPVVAALLAEALSDISAVAMDDPLDLFSCRNSQLHGPDVAKQASGLRGSPEVRRVREALGRRCQKRGKAC